MYTLRMGDKQLGNFVQVNGTKHTLEIEWQPTMCVEFIYSTNLDEDLKITTGFKCTDWGILPSYCFPAICKPDARRRTFYWTFQLEFKDRLLTTFI